MREDNVPSLPPARRRRKPTRSTMIARLWRTAEKQVAEIETRIDAAGGDAATLERDAKTLSVLARTVRDLVALDDVQAGSKRTAEENDAHDAPRSFEQFRRELADKLAQIATERGFG